MAAIGKILFTFFVIALLVVPLRSAYAIPVEEVGPLLGVATSIATNTSATAVAANTSVVALNSLVLSLGVPAATQATVESLKLAELAACRAAETQENLRLFETADTFTGTFSFIGGSPGEAAFIQKKILALTALKLCKDTQLLILRRQPTFSLLASSEFARAEAKLNAELNQINKRLEDLIARRSMTIKEVLKAVALRITLGLSQRITTNVVNGLVENYKVSSFLDQSDAVAGQLYATDFIRKNYKSGQDQAIIRSLLRNEQLPTGSITPLIRAQVTSNQNCNIKEAPIEDPNFYSAFLSAGSFDCNMEFQQTNYTDQSVAVRAAAEKAAYLEISQSKGYIPPRDCGETLGTQESIDSNRIQLQQQYTAAAEVERRLGEGRARNPAAVSAADLEQAAKATKDAEKALLDLPKTSDMLVQLCKGINSPAAFVADGITNYTNTLFLEKSKMDPNNLPLWGRLIADMTTNFLNNIIEGNKINSTLVAEAGFRTPSIIDSVKSTLVGSEDLEAHDPTATVSVKEVIGQQSGGTGSGGSSGGGTTRGAQVIQPRGTISPRN